MKTKADSPYYDKYQEQPFNPEELYRKHDNYTLYDQMREDDQINSVLTLKKLLIIDSKYEIVVDESDKQEEIKDFLEKNLDEYCDDSIDKKLYNILSCKDYGFSLTEKVFGYKDTEYGPRVVLKALKTRPPHSFREIIQDDDGTIKAIRQDTAIAGLIDLDPKKFIHFANMREFDIPWGRSELNLGVYRAWWSKKQIIKFWNMYLERHGIPPVVGTIPLSLSHEKENLLNVIDNLQAKTGITVPEGVTVELLTDTASKGETGFERAIDKYNTMIARSMLIPDLTGMSGSETGGGSYSLGQEQIGILFSVIQQDRRQLERIITREIINPLVLWNYGSGYNAKFVFRQVDEKRKVEQSKVFLEAVKTGKIDPNFSQMNHFLNSVDFPEFEEDEWEEIQEKKEEMRESMQNGFDNAGDDKKEDEKESKSDTGKENPKEAKKEEDKKEFIKSPYFREFTEYEKKENFQKIESDSEQLSTEFLPKLNDAFSLVINGLLSDIKGRKIVENKKIEAVNKLRLRNIAKVKKTFKDLAKTSYLAGLMSAPNPRKDFISDDASSLDNEDVVAWLAEHADSITDGEAAEILKASKQTLFDAIRNGKGIRETMTTLDKALEGWDLTRTINENIKIDRTLRLETIARTVTATAYNEARSQKFNELKDVIIGYQFSAIMDGRTSPVCTALDGKRIKPSEIENYTPPLHFNCRSLIVPIFETEELEKFDKLPNTEVDKRGFLKLRK